MNEFSISNAQSPLFGAPSIRIGEEMSRLIFFGKAVPFGEFIPVALNYTFAALSSIRSVNYSTLSVSPYYFGKFNIGDDYIAVSQDYSYKSFIYKIGIYNYRLVVAKGMVIDFYTRKPLLVVAYLNEYSNTIRSFNINTNTFQYQADKLVLFVDRNLKNTSFLRHFFKVYPEFMDKIEWASDLNDFLDGIKLNQIKGSLQDFQINSMHNFLKENKVDESVLSGEQGELLKVEEL